MAITANGYRYMMLVSLFAVAFSSYFCYDLPAALQDVLQNLLRINYSQYVLFYSLYAWPNVVLCLVGGFLVDKVLGVSNSVVLFAFLVTGGQFALAIGAYTNKLWLMLCGRILYAIGNEPLGVAITTTIMKHFSGKQANLIFGLQSSIEFSSDCLSINVAVPLFSMINTYRKASHNDWTRVECLGITFFITASICSVALLLGPLIVWLERLTARAKRQEKALLRSETAVPRAAPHAATDTSPLMAEAIVPSSSREADEDSSEGGEENTEEVNLNQLVYVLRFPGGYWILVGILMTYTGSVFSLIDVALVYYEAKYGLEAGTANLANSLVYLIAVLGCPVAGYAVDRFGRNSQFIIIGVFTAVFAHTLLAFTFVSPFFCSFLFGISYSLFSSALWGAAVYLVPNDFLGTAYGLLQAAENLSLGVLVLIVGALLDSAGYLLNELFLFMLACFALLLSGGLYAWSKYGADGRYNVLNMNAEQRAAELASREAIEEPQNQVA